MSTSRQQPPQADNRYRVHRSVKCYLAELACGTKGCTWFFHGSVERVVYLFPGGVEKIQYRNNFYPLQPADRLREIVAEQLRLGGAVNLAGKYIAPHEKENGFDAYPFIDLSSHDDKEFYRQLLSQHPSK